MKNVYNIIIKNLEGRPHPINLLCATAGINDASEGFKALRKLVEDGRVEEFSARTNPQIPPLYRLRKTLNY